jgi:hypothetical protein
VIDHVVDRSIPLDDLVAARYAAMGRTNRCSVCLNQRGEAARGRRQIDPTSSLN